MTETIEEESSPPDRQVPTVTSATSRRSTARLERGAERGRIGLGAAESRGVQ